MSRETSSRRLPSEASERRARRLAWARKLETILQRLGINEWDYLLVGDGSGNLWPYPCAFATLLIERETDTREVYFGGFNHGTNNYAELNAYCNPLDWLCEQPSIRRQKSGACRVHVLSDSEWVVKTGNGQWARSSHVPTWAKYDAYRRFGIFVHWHWIPGHAGIPANEFSDKLAGQVRELLKAHSIDSALESVQRRTVQGLYPAPR